MSDLTHSKHCMKTIWGDKYQCDCHMARIAELEAENRTLKNLGESRLKRIDLLQARVEALDTWCEQTNPDAYEKWKALETTEQDESLTDKLKRLGYEEILDAKCVICGTPINSQVDTQFCSVACQLAATEQEGE